MADKGRRMNTMEIAMIHALAAIDAELGLPEDGCNSTARTLAAIKKLKGVQHPRLTLGIESGPFNDGPAPYYKIECAVLHAFEEQLGASAND